MSMDYHGTPQTPRSLYDNVTPRNAHALTHPSTAHSPAPKDPDAIIIDNGTCSRNIDQTLFPKDSNDSQNGDLRLKLDCVETDIILGADRRSSQGSSITPINTPTLTPAEYLCCCKLCHVTIGSVCISFIHALLLLSTGIFSAYLFARVETRYLKPAAICLSPAVLGGVGIVSFYLGLRKQHEAFIAVYLVIYSLLILYFVVINSVGIHYALAFDLDKDQTAKRLVVQNFGDFFHINMKKRWDRRLALLSLYTLAVATITAIELWWLRVVLATFRYVRQSRKAGSMPDLAPPSTSRANSPTAVSHALQRKHSHHANGPRSSLHGHAAIQKRSMSIPYAPSHVLPGVYFDEHAPMMQYYNRSDSIATTTAATRPLRKISQAIKQPIQINR